MSSDTPPISFTEDGLDKIFDRLSHYGEHADVNQIYSTCRQAADAIAYLRRERAQLLAILEAAKGATECEAMCRPCKGQLRKAIRGYAAHRAKP